MVVYVGMSIGLQRPFRTGLHAEEAGHELYLSRASRCLIHTSEAEV